MTIHHLSGLNHLSTGKKGSLQVKEGLHSEKAEIQGLTNMQTPMPITAYLYKDPLQAHIPSSDCVVCA